MQTFIKNSLKKHPYWNEIESIILKLSEKDFEVVIVGGAVRNALLNKAITDIDLATSAKPEQIVKIFPKSNSNFKKYGTLFIPLKNKHKLEITTFRKESNYKDGRRPKSVKYSSLKEDAQRRDFTINALFYNLKTDQVIDLFNGFKDLKNKKIKTVGKAEKRFKEDHLRMLRALRLAQQLNFRLDKEIIKAFLKLNKNIKKISKERILKELMLMFSAGKIDTILKELNNYGFFQYIFPELKIEKKYFNFWEKKFSFFSHPDLFWVFIGLPFFHSNRKSFSDFLTNYPIKKSIIKQSLSYLKSIQTLIDLNKSFTDKLMALNREKSLIYELTFQFLQSDILKNKNSKKIIQNLKFILKEFEKREINNKLPEPLLKGADLLKLCPSLKKQNFSKILKKAFICQIENPKLNKKDILKKLHV